MVITRQILADQIAAYLRHQISAPQLVDWAERQMMEGDFTPADAQILAQVMGRLGLADVREFGLTWDDCERLLRQLGFEAHVEIVTA